MTYAPPPPDVAADLAHFVATRRPDCIPHPRPTPNVLYRIVATDTGNVYACPMDGREVQRITVTRRDADDEPWGDPVGLGMPRPRMTLLGALWRIVTWKYRRVF